MLPFKTSKNKAEVKYKLIPKHELAGQAAFHFLYTQVARSSFITFACRSVCPCRSVGLGKY